MHFFATQFTTLAWVMMGKQNTTIKYLQSKRTRSFQNHVYVRIMYLVLTFKKNHPPTPLLSKIFYIRQITNQLINSEVLEKIFLPTYLNPKKYSSKPKLTFFLTFMCGIDNKTIRG